LKSKDRCLHFPADGLTVMSALRQGEDFCLLDKILRKAMGAMSVSVIEIYTHAYQL